jgi:AcrR family transcriptional regulator
MRRKEGDKATEILNASIRVFARDGFDKAQVSAIAQEAGVGTGSIYLYFAGKEDILHGIFARFWENLASQMESLPQTDPLFRMNDQLGLFFDALVESPNLAKVYLRDHHRFAESPATKGLAWHRTCLDLGRKAFAEIAQASGKKAPSATTLDLAQAFLFGGVRAALEFGLARSMETAQVRRHMQTMAMASLLAAIEGVEP